MAEHKRSLETAASPEAVWRIWSDPTSWSDWNPSVGEVKLEGPFAVGASGMMHMRSGRQHQIRFERIEPGRAFELEATALPGHPFSFRCEVVPVGSGSRVSQSVTVRGPLAAILSPVVGEQVAKTFEPILRALAERAEAVDRG